MRTSPPPKKNLKRPSNRTIETHGMALGHGVIIFNSTISPFFNDGTQFIDEVAEWLRHWTANPMGSARVGSNPIVDYCFLMDRMINRFSEVN